MTASTSCQPIHCPQYYNRSIVRVEQEGFAFVTRETLKSRPSRTAASRRGKRCVKFRPLLNISVRPSRRARLRNKDAEDVNERRLRRPRLRGGEERKVGRVRGPAEPVVAVNTRRLKDVRTIRPQSSVVRLPARGEADERQVEVTVDARRCTTVFVGVGETRIVAVQTAQRVVEVQVEVSDEARVQLNLKRVVAALRRGHPLEAELACPFSVETAARVADDVGFAAFRCDEAGVLNRFVNVAVKVAASENRAGKTSR